MDKKIKNKNCLIVGATGGIGSIITKMLIEEECNLFLTGRNKKILEKLSENKNNKIKIYATDLTKENNIKKLINKVRKEFTHIDILINCAGIFLIKTLEKSSIDDLTDLLQINMKVPFILTKEFSKDMEKRKWGRIINLGSSSSYEGFSKGSIYCLTKHAILGFSRSMHEELKNKGIRTFCISPASTKTEMAKLSTDQDFSTFLDPKEVAKFIIQTISYDENLVANEVRLNRMEIK
jgi:short-subunit dehydrogenase